MGGAFGCWFSNKAFAEAQGKLLMLAGGIGITPLASMLRGMALPAATARTVLGPVGQGCGGGRRKAGLESGRSYWWLEKPLGRAARACCQNQVRPVGQPRGILGPFGYTAGNTPP